MALAVGDILQITDVQQMATNQLLNVYTYEVEALESGASYEKIANQFQTIVQAPQLQVQHTSLQHTQVIIKNLSNGVDIYEKATAVTGAETGEPHPNFVALGFRLTRETGLTRHGQKRIGGIAENVTNGNGIMSTYVVRLAPIQAGLVADLVGPSGSVLDFTLRPVIVGRFPKGTPNEGQYDLSKINGISAAQYIRVTSQTTRRIGRGA